MNQGGLLVKKVFQCVPMRVTAIHFCTPGNQPFFQVLTSVFAWTISRGSLRSRLRIHSGKPLELRYDLIGYGIPVDLLPLTSTGNVKTIYLKQWMRMRTTIEEGILTGEKYLYPGSFGGGGDGAAVADYYRRNWIECPGSNDVIFKPGKPVRNHPGNVTFRSLIELWSETHERATQTKKSEIAMRLVDEVLRVRGGRFLVWDEPKTGYLSGGGGGNQNVVQGSWKALEDPYAQRQKVATAFRNFKSNKRPMYIRQTNMATATISSTSMHTDSNISETSLEPSDTTFDSRSNKRKKCDDCSVSDCADSL